MTSVTKLVQIRTVGPVMLSLESLLSFQWLLKSFLF